MNANKPQVAIIGASGYTGLELVRLLLDHPEVELSAIASRRQAGRRLDEVHPQLRGASDLIFIAPEALPLDECALVFFATPSGVAMREAPALLERGLKVVDLSADFRLDDAGEWSRWYGEKHLAGDYLPQAVYGLSEYCRERLKTADLVANPGCYPTAILLAALPLLEAGVAFSERLCVAAYSGLSGAGREPATQFLLTEASQSVGAYAASGHRHLPEMERMLHSVDSAARLAFVPHLAPMSRGLHATLFAPMKKPLEAPQLHSLYAERYADEPFVDLLPIGEHPHTGHLRGGNACRLAVATAGDGDTAVILSAIDNLVKGAAGQAVQNMNLMLGWDECQGLTAGGVHP